MNTIALTAASSQDIQSIAQLHAKSWRIAYRGMLPDDYLDQRVVEDRIAFWTTRFDTVPPDRRLVLKAGSDEVETATRPVAQDLSVPELRYWWSGTPGGGTSPTGNAPG